MIKKFDQMNEGTSYDGITLKEFLGEFIDKQKMISLTSNGIYTDFSEGDIDRWGDDIIKLEGEYTPKDIYVIRTKGEKDKYFFEIGYILFKDDKPFIFSGIPGDYMGAIVFNNTFIASGHDGSLLFNISNPFEYYRNTH